MKTTRRMIAMLLAIFSIVGMFANAPAASAASTSAYDCLSDSNYAKAYPVNTSTIIPYTSTSLNQRGTITYGASSSAYIDGYNDLLYVMDAGINSNGEAWAKVSYPIGSNKRANAYIRLSDLTANTHSTKSVSNGKYLCALRQNGALNSSYYVAKGDTVWLLAVAGSRVQILYPTSGSAYRIAWAEKSDYEKYCGAIPDSSSNIINVPTGSTTNPVSGSFVRIRYSVNGRYVDIPAEGISKNGTQLQLWDYAPGNQNQIFQLIDTGKGWRIISLQSGKVIEVRNSSHDDCAQVAQWDKHDQNCARWDIVKNSNGTVSFRNRESGKYLNVCGGGNASNGTKMIQYHNDKTAAMQFFIEPVTCGSYTTVTNTIPSSKVKQEKDLNVRNWNPLCGLTETMLAQDDSVEALVDVPVLLDAATFVLEWMSNSSNITRIHVTEGINKQLCIQYGTSIEVNRSGRKMTLDLMLTEAHSGEAGYVLWAASDADKCVRNWFGLKGDGRYNIEMTFGKVKYGDYGYSLVIRNGVVYQTPLIHPDSTYIIYYKENGKWSPVMDAANILRSVQLQLAEEEARTVMIQLVNSGYIK